MLHSSDGAKEPVLGNGTAGVLRPSVDTAKRSGAHLVLETTPWAPLKNVDTVDIQKSTIRYAAWHHAPRTRDMLPNEFLLPRLVTDKSGELPPSMRLAQTSPRRELLPQFRQHKWGYYFSLGEGQSTIGVESRFNAELKRVRNRCLYRLNMINGGIEALYGGNLAGKSVIDIACNWGAFGLDMAARNAGKVVGVDLRADNIRKASLLRDYLGLNQVELSTRNAFDLGPRSFDIVLLLGLLYHVTAPYELVKRAYHMTNEICVIDTATHREPVSGFILGTGQNIPQDHAAGAIGVELHPTYRGLIDLMVMVGFRDIIEVVGTPDPAWEDWEKDPYYNFWRRCLIGFK